MTRFGGRDLRIQSSRRMSTTDILEHVDLKSGQIVSSRRVCSPDYFWGPFVPMLVESEVVFLSKGPRLLLLLASGLRSFMQVAVAKMFCCSRNPVKLKWVGHIPMSSGFPFVCLSANTNTSDQNLGGSKIETTYGA